MKRIINSVLTIVLILCLVSCNIKQTEEIKYKSYVTSSANDGIVAIEKDWWPGTAQPVDTQLQATKKLIYEDVEYTIEYDDSYRIVHSANEVERYENSDIKFVFNKKDGTLVSYSLWNKMMREEYYQKSDIENPREYADTLAQKIAEKYIDISKYSLYVVENDRTLGDLSYTDYYYIYTKVLDGYYTGDRVRIAITSKGDLQALSMIDIGCYDNIDTTKIDMNEVEKSVAAKIEEIYGEKYTYTYSIYDNSEYDSFVIGATPEGEAVISSTYKVNLTTKEGTKISTLVQISTCLGQTVKSVSQKSLQYQAIAE